MDFGTDGEPADEVRERRVDDRVAREGERRLRVVELDRRQRRQRTDGQP